MMQRYFAGELRPDQLESWRAPDGIFYLVSEVDAEMKENNEFIRVLKDALEQNSPNLILKEQITTLTDQLQNTEYALVSEQKVIEERDRQVAELNESFNAWNYCEGDFHPPSAEAVIVIAALKTKTEVKR